jgi:hypothetical protein
MNQIQLKSKLRKKKRKYDYYWKNNNHTERIGGMWSYWLDKREDKLCSYPYGPCYEKL